MTWQSLTWNPQGKKKRGRPRPGAVTLMQMLSRWTKHIGSWRDSPRTETPRGGWWAMGPQGR
ncbi:hypothetical protein DPMN_179773 [Dreissena polymorpha]|uniref:Uncharacterized protein n=1 Tax=Dreissena polymorpha TaxID=45954 RepID=A0A9D4EFE1_DREPO|nr:hypothetical protein DPMN_179773 [Dreissena polymorpha]